MNNSSIIRTSPGKGVVPKKPGQLPLVSGGSAQNSRIPQSYQQQTTTAAHTVVPLINNPLQWSITKHHPSKDKESHGIRT